MSGNPFAAAMIAAQLEVPSIEKGDTVNAGKFKYRYADLARMLSAIRPVFAKHDLMIRFGAQVTPVGTTISCVIEHAASEGYREAALPVTLPSDPQESGKVITYYKRYLLGLATGIVAEEDDDMAEAAPASHSRTGRKGGEDRPSSSGGAIAEPGGASRDEEAAIKSNAIEYAKGELTKAFGEEDFEPDKLRVLKDLTGSGKWPDFLNRTWPDLQPFFQRQAHPELAGESRFVACISLVKAGIRRPEDMPPDEWPHWHFAQLVSVEGAGE